MSLSGTFNPSNTEQTYNKPAGKRSSRPAPFSLRLSEAERAQLIQNAAGTPLGAYIKERLFGDARPARKRAGKELDSKKALAQTLALLGQSRFASNLNQLAHLGNIGALPFSPEMEAELREALDHIADIRRVLMSALGLKPEAGR